MPDYDATTASRKGEKVLRHGISTKNFWGTPGDVFQELDKEFDFDLDAAAERGSAKCSDWLGLDHPDPTRRDSLGGPSWPGLRSFLNPSYSPDGGTLFRWTVRAHSESKNKEHVVCLLPGTADTDWANYCFEHADEMRFTPRIAFIDPNGGRTAPMGGSLVVVFRKEPIWRTTLYLDHAYVTLGYAPWKKGK